MHNDHIAVGVPYTMSNTYVYRVQSESYKAQCLFIPPRELDLLIWSRPEPGGDQTSPQLLELSLHHIHTGPCTGLLILHKRGG